MIASLFSEDGSVNDDRNAMRYFTCLSPSLLPLVDSNGDLVANNSSMISFWNAPACSKSICESSYFESAFFGF